MAWIVATGVFLEFLTLGTCSYTLSSFETEILFHYFGNNYKLFLPNKQKISCQIFGYCYDEYIVFLLFQFYCFGFYMYVSSFVFLGR